jgi:predicted nucleic acid-binding protein
MTLRFLDTNILLYSISRDPTETAKRDRAVALIDAGGNALSVQLLQEFYVQATRPTRRDALPHDIAAGLIRTWLRFKVQETSVSIMTGALDIKVEHGLSYWDAAIVAAFIDESGRQERIGRVFDEFGGAPGSVKKGCLI